MLLTAVLSFSFVTTAFGLVAYAGAGVVAGAVLAGAALLVIILERHALRLLAHALAQRSRVAVAGLGLFFLLLASFSFAFSFGFWWDALGLQNQGRGLASSRQAQLSALVAGHSQLRSAQQRLTDLARSADSARLTEKERGGACGVASEPSGAGPRMMLLNAQTETYASMAAALEADLREYDEQLRVFRTRAASLDEEAFHSEIAGMISEYNARFVQGLRDEARLLKSDAEAFASGRGLSDPAGGKPLVCLNSSIAAAAAQSAAELAGIDAIEPPGLEAGRSRPGRAGIDRLLSARLAGADWLALLVPLIMAAATLLLGLAPRRSDARRGCGPEAMDPLEPEARDRGASV
jgi:hypothetical protein